MTEAFESFSSGFLQVCIELALIFVSLAFMMTAIRIARGPTLADRVLGLDMLSSAAIGFIAILAVKTRHYLYLDIAISLGLVGFLATVAFASYILRRDGGGRR